jgi:hypothetical protein
MSIVFEKKRFPARRVYSIGLPGSESFKRVSRKRENKKYDRAGDCLPIGKIRT